MTQNHSLLISEYFKKFLLCLCILVTTTVPSTFARPPPSNLPTLTEQLASMAAHSERFVPESLLELCGNTMQRRRINLTEIERMINRTLLLCNRAIIEAERTGDNYVSITHILLLYAHNFLSLSISMRQRALYGLRQFSRIIN